MRIWNNYCKEMKISSRGFYFYIEIVIAIIALVTLLAVVPMESKNVSKEVVFMDMPDKSISNVFDTQIKQGTIKQSDDTTFKLKPIIISYTDEESGKEVTKDFNDKKEIKLKTYLGYDSETGKKNSIRYITDNFDDMVRLTYSKKFIGSQMWLGNDGLDYYKSFLWGNETDRYRNLLTAAHSNIDLNMVIQNMNNQDVEILGNKQSLNTRQNIIPLIIVLMNGLMSMMIIVSYITEDKSEGLIKAFSVTPTKMWQYLSSKILVVLTTSILSTLIITLPVMKTQPNYLLLILTTICLVFFSSSLGLLVASWFKDLKSSFGIFILLTLVLALPSISYFIPAFSPTWVKFLPTYYMLEGTKETLLLNTDIQFVLLTNLGLVIASLILFVLADRRYKKILTI